MTQAATISTPTAPSSGKMLRAMVGIGVLCALLIVLVFEGTLPRVERLRAEALEKAIFKVLPGTVEMAPYQIDQNGQLMPLENDEKAETQVFAGFDENGKLIGVAVEASGMGYADIIRILYGYDPENQKIIGFHVLESKETPGLGDKIEKEQRFLDNFKALDVELTLDGNPKNMVTAVKQGDKKNAWEIDGITGATISSRAIGDIIQVSSTEDLPVIYTNRKQFRKQVRAQNRGGTDGE